MNINTKCLLIGISLLALFQMDALAQSEERITDFSRPGRPTMFVYVWGSSSTPGIWKVEQEVDLLELLSSAQIPNFGSTDNSTKSTVTVRLYRSSGGKRVEIFNSEMNALLTSGKIYPDLQENDIIMIETKSKQRFNLQTVFSAIGAAASLVLLAIRVNQL